MSAWIKYVRRGDQQETDITPPKGYALHTIISSGDIGVYFVFIRR